MVDPLIIASLIPAVADVAKNLFSALSRRIGGLSVDDEIKLANLDIERMQALAQLDVPGGTPSQWIIDLRASFRYIAAIIVILTGAVLLYLGHADGAANLTDLGAQLIGLPFVLIFGERMVLSLKTRAK